MKRAIFITVTLILLALVLYNLDWDKIKDFLHNCDLKKIAIAYILYIGSFWARALRWKIMLKKPVLTRLFSTVSIHTLANNIYPARSGELSFLYLLKEHKKSELASVLLIARLSDLASICLIFGTSVIVLFKDHFIALASLALSGLICVVTLLTPKAIESIKKRLPQKLAVKVENLHQALKEQKGLLPATFTASLIVWMVKYLSFFFLSNAVLESMGRRVSLWQAVFGVSFSELTTVLPIHSFGGFGTFEAGWTGAYMILGFPKEIAVTSGFLFHVSLLLFSTLTALPFLMLHKEANP